MSAIPTSEAIALALTVIDDQVHGRWAAITQRFDETMRAELTEEELAKGWAYLAKTAQVYKAHGEPVVHRDPDRDLTITNTPLAFEGGEYVARVVFRDDRTIAGLFILDADPAGGSDAGSPAT